MIYYLRTIQTLVVLWIALWSSNGLTFEKPISLKTAIHMAEKVGPLLSGRYTSGPNGDDATAYAELTYVNKNVFSLRTKFKVETVSDGANRVFQCELPITTQFAIDRTSSHDDAVLIGSHVFDRSCKVELEISDSNVSVAFLRRRTGDFTSTGCEQVCAGLKGIEGVNSVAYDFYNYVTHQKILAFRTREK